MQTTHITKENALSWFTFFAELPEDEELTVDQIEYVYAVMAKIEDAVDQKHQQLMHEIKDLKTLDERTYYVGDENAFPMGCRSCLLGTGLSAVRKTNKCNIVCKFCYNYGELDDILPIGEGMWEIGGSKYYEKDIDLLLKIQEKPTGIAYVYLEPFIEIEKYYPIIHKFSQAGVHQHMYTNGTLVTKENLKALKEAGLDELRFNLGASNTSDKVIGNIALAKQYIPKVGIETPMTPEFFQAFLNKKDAILSTGLDFINCAELHLNENNLDNYLGEEMYMSRLGYISPIWSREISLKIMKMASDEQWNVLVHDCSNHTKFARGINFGKHSAMGFGTSNYGFEFSAIPFEAFLPTLEGDTIDF